MWLMCLLLLTGQVRAAGILLVASSGAELYDRFIASFTASLPAGEFGPDSTKPTIVHLDEHVLTRNDLAASELVISVGTRAARAVASLKPAIPVLYTVIPESVYRTLVTPGGTCATHSAIFIDQPLARQAALARSLFPAAVKYGVLLGPTSIQRQPEIDALEQMTGRELVVSVAGHEDEIIRTSSRLLYGIDLLLAVNDPLVLNRENAKWLLYAAYQRGLPVIGFSRAYVTAGAAGAVFSEPEQMARQAAEVVQRHAGAASNCLPAAGFPHYFSVAINQSVCSSLGGASCDEEALSALLTSGESEK
jgi:ABC-type uncharacterized transport system substrate-binding protein